MQTNQEALSPLERRLDMAVPLAEIDKDVHQRLKKLARTVKMSGFRPGKVPMRIVAQQYGPQARSEAIAEPVNRAFGQAVRDQNLRVAGYPKIEPKSHENASHMEFSAVFEVYPEIKLGDLSNEEIERPILTVGEAEVDKTIEVLRKQRTTFSAVEKGADDSDRVTIDFAGRLNGKVFEGGQAADYRIVIGAGTMIADFESNLKGVSAGGRKNFEVTFPDTYHAQGLAGKTVQFEVYVKLVEAPRLPDIDGDFARSLGIRDGDVARMRNEVRANLEREVKKRIQGRLKDHAMNILLRVNPIDVPRALVDLEARQMVEAARHDLQNRGVDSKNVPIEAAWFSDQAMRRVRLGLILAEMVREKQLHAKPEQVRSFVDELAHSYEDPTEVVRWYYSQPQRLAEAEALVIEANVVEWVLANARTCTKPLAFDELMATAA